MLLAAATALGTAVSAQAYVARTLTPAQLAADAVLLRQAIETVHPGFGRYMPRRYTHDSSFARLARRAEAPMTDVEFYHDVALITARLRCNHTKAEYPAALTAWRETHATNMPVRVRVFGKQLLVDTAAGNVIARGTEILRINGIPASDVITKLARYAAVDGFTDFSRAALLERDPDLMGSDLEHYWPIEFGFADGWSIVVRTASGAERTVTLAPIGYRDWLALRIEGTDVDFRSGTRWSMLDDTTALLTIRSFVNYRAPVNADSVYATIFGQLRRRSARHLVIDLRQNGGGSDDASDGLIRWLADRPVQPVRRVRRRTIRITGALADAFDTWGDRTAIMTPAESLFTAASDGWFEERTHAGLLTPAPEAFRGRVSVLVGHRNGSGATKLLAVLQEMGARTRRLRLVGEETGGSAEGPTAGQILFLTLPNSGIRVRIPLERTDVDVAQFVPGMGIFPDVDATESIADFRLRIDRALRTARTMPWTIPASPLAPTVGLLRGELEYLDYTSRQRTTIPSWLHTSPIGTTGAFRQRTIYDDGPGNTIYSSDVIKLRGTTWTEGDTGPESETPGAPHTLRVISRRRTADGLTLVLRGAGMDDERPVEFQYTVTAGPSSFIRLKEFRPRGNARAPFSYRHEYRYFRDSVPSP